MRIWSGRSSPAGLSSCTQNSTGSTLTLMAAAVNVNGQLFDPEHAVISVFDHGFLYGEGVYETLREISKRTIKSVIQKVGGDMRR